MAKSGSLHTLQKAGASRIAEYKVDMADAAFCKVVL